METTNKMFKRSLIVFVITGMFFAACTTQTKDSTMPYKVSPKAQWVKELQQKNPLKDSANYTNVYFRFDTILNDFEVSGILYPRRVKEKYAWEAHESGVRLFFHNLKTDKEYLWTNMNYEEEAYKPYFMSINVTNLICEKRSKAFKDGDVYIFRYDTTTYKYSDNSLLPYAEYQFYDADFDGEDELIRGYYVGGPHGSPYYEICEITDSGLVEKKVEGDCWFGINADTKFDPKNRIISCTIYEGAYDWGEYFYKVDKKGNIHPWYHVSFVKDTNHTIIPLDTIFYQ